MKKLSLILSLFLLVAISSVSGLQAQSIIPSAGVELDENSLVFIEDGTQGTFSLEERKMNVKIEDPRPDQVLPVVVILYSNDGTNELGPYTVSENSQLEVSIDGAEWTVEVISYTAGTEMSVWTE